MRSLKNSIEIYKIGYEYLSFLYVHQIKQKYDWLKTKVEDCLLEWSKSAQVIENNRK